MYHVKSSSGGESGAREGHGFREQELNVRGFGRRPAQPRGHVCAAVQRQEAGSQKGTLFIHITRFFCC